MANELNELAHQVLRSRYKPNAFSYSLFTVHDWVNAAESALELGDYSDLVWMSARDEEFDEVREEECDRLGCNYADYARDTRRDREDV